MKLQLITVQVIMLFTTMAQYEYGYNDPWAEYQQNFEAASAAL